MGRQGMSPRDRKGLQVIEIAICDDEQRMQEQLAQMVERRCPDCRVECFSSGGELLAADRRFDMIFLDIQMEEPDGIETAARIRERDKRVVLIFVTALKEYVFRAFDVGAFHYLLKPLEEERFAKVLEKAVSEVMDRSEREAPPVFLKTRYRNFILRPEEILYLESRGKKVAVHTVSKVIEVYAAMRDLERQLGSGFYRCHRGYLVNLAHIAEYGNESIDMSNGERVYLAREKSREFVKTYMRYLQSGGTAGV